MSLEKGKEAEKIAEDFLKKKELTFITKNFYCNFGEIDLIMLDKNEIVFVEVRARKNKSHGTAAESISPAKQKKICKSAEYFLHTNSQYQNHHCRFDVVELNDFRETSSNINWIKDAFWLNDKFSIL